MTTAATLTPDGSGLSAACEHNTPWVCDAVKAESKRERVLVVEAVAVVCDALGLGYWRRP